jgi:LysM repeat protein
MKDADRQKSTGSTTSDALILVAIAGLGYALITGSDFSRLGSGIGWHSIERTWERNLAAVTEFLGASRASVPKRSARQVESSESGHRASYAVRLGDTLSGIAEAHGVTLDALVSINRIGDPDRLVVGVTILIPETDPTLREAALAPVVEPLQAEREISVETQTELQAQPAESRGGIEIAADALDRLLRGLRIEGWGDGFVGGGIGNGMWTTDAAATPHTDLRAVDGLLALAEDELHGAYFQNALETSQTALRLLELEDDPNRANPRRARLEVFRATAHTAFGNSRAALLSFERALESDPNLVLDSARYSPKVLRAFGKACLEAPPSRELACRSSGRDGERPERAAPGDRIGAQSLHGDVEPG